MTLTALGDGASRETIEAALRCANLAALDDATRPVQTFAIDDRADLRPAARRLALYPWFFRAEEGK